MSYYDNSLDIINLRGRQFRRLSFLSIPKGVFNSEGLLLTLNKNYKTCNGKRVLFKCLDAQESPRIMDRKLDIVDYLHTSKYNELDELVVPEYLVMVDNEFAGFGMELIEQSRNLGHVINSNKVDFKSKKKYLEQLGDLIDKVDRVEDDKKFYFGDLNEYNFLIDKNDNIKAIDLDSSYVDGLEGISPPSMAFYLLRNFDLWSLPNKYKRSNLGIVIPNKDSDLYSYLMIILSIISNHNMHEEDMTTYYRYLLFLESKGVDPRLIDMFRNVYSSKENENPRGLISGLDDNLPHSTSFKQFKKSF